MRLDSNQAWKDAGNLVAANRDVLLAIAGVFFVLPAFALGMFFPQPQPPAGATPEQMLAVFKTYYGDQWLWLVLSGVLQILGTLTMLALFTDRSRPTVAEAIGQGARGVLPVLGAQLLFMLAAMIGLGVPLGLLGATGVVPLVVLGLLAGLVALIYVSVRVSLVSPLVIVEGLRNPITALQRSWELTRNNGWRMLGFFVLIFIAFVVVLLLVMAVVGLLVAALAEGRLADVVTGLVSSVLGGVVTIYFTAVIAAVHRQLAGPSHDVVAKLFD